MINANLVKKIVSDKPLLRKAYGVLVNDPEVQILWEMANVMAVKRLKYNDHGPVHAQIAAGASLYLYQLLLDAGIKSTLLRDKLIDDPELAWIVPLYGALLHDIGNAIHRDLHEKLGSLLAKPIIERALEKLIDDPRTRIVLRQEIMHSIHCTAYDVVCLTIEAGCVGVGDGLDMAEGRARVPYRLGGISIHSVSALSIKKVEVVPGESVPIKIMVHMNERAGIFQVDEVLMPKIKTTPLKDYVEVYAIINGEPLKTYTPKK